MKIIKGILFVLFLTLWLPCLAFAERVVLKNGESFDGTILERNDEYIKIQTGGAPVYLSMDQIEKILDNDEIAKQFNRPVQTRPSTPVRAVEELQMPNIPTVDLQAGQALYEEARRELQVGNLKASAEKLYKAISMGVEDKQGLKTQLEFAMAAVKGVDAQKNALKEMADKMDPQTYNIVMRIGTIVAGIIGILILITIFKSFRKESDLSHFVKAKPMDLPMEGAGGYVFVKAGPNKRACAFLIDLMVISVPGLVAAFLGGSLITVLILLVYILLKDCFDGQSLGKRLVKIKVVDGNNEPAGPSLIVLRNLFWIVVCVLPLFHIYLAFGSVAILIFEVAGIFKDRQGQRFGDKISSTRVADLKPRSADWKFFFISLLVVALTLAIYRGSAIVLLEILKKSGYAVGMKEYKDPQNRFSFNVPSGFLIDPNYAQGNALVFNGLDGKRLFSVFIVERNEAQVLDEDQLDMVAASFLALKLKTEVRDVLTRTSLARTKIAGHHATIFTYQADTGKVVSVCLLQDKQFFEISFLFKEGDIDQNLVAAVLTNFRI